MMILTTDENGLVSCDKFEDEIIINKSLLGKTDPKILRIEMEEEILISGMVRMNFKNGSAVYDIYSYNFNTDEFKARLTYKDEI